MCTRLRQGQAVDCCQRQCWEDPNCDAINVNPSNGKCIKRGCGPRNISRPDTTAPGFDSYHLQEAVQPAGPLAGGVSFALPDVGFAFNTRVVIHDVFSGK